jgi:hypothetical protein
MDPSGSERRPVAGTLKKIFYEATSLHLSLFHQLNYLMYAY